MSETRHRAIVATAVLAGLLAVATGTGQDVIKSPVRITIKDEKSMAALEPALPIDTAQHLQLNSQNNMMFNITVDGKTMHLGVIQTMFQVDGQNVFPGNFPGRLVTQNQPLAKKQGKDRRGVMSVCDVRNLMISQTVEVVPTRPHGSYKKRRMDAVLVRYDVDNKDRMPHKVGVRIFMDVFLVNNDGALFAAPNRPGKVLDGVELKGKDVPDYLQILQMPDLKNPGFVAHLTYNFGKSIERADRVVLTSLMNPFIDQWNMRAIPANGDSAMGFFWDPKEVPAGGKRAMAYGFGEGICPNPGGDGDLAVVLGGSLEPGKLFSIAAHVQNPAPGQVLTLELPPGMERVEGKERQPVPAVNDDGNAMVLWKARVLRTGEFPLRVRSSTGVTQTKLITISKS